MTFLSKHFPQIKYPFCTMVVAAAGTSSRMGEDKLFLDLEGMPVLARTLRVFQDCPCVHEVIVVTRSERIVEVAGLCREYGLDKVTKVLVGGASRTESVLAGVSEANARAVLIGIHDGARPFVPMTVVEQAVNEAKFYQAVAPAVPLRDTVKRVNQATVEETPPRESLMAVQTPQVFRAELIKGALTYVLEREIPVTDDCAAVEAIGGRVHLIPGDERNLKLTTPLDMELAYTILREQEMRP